MDYRKFTRQYLYYILVGIVSVLMLVFLPCLNTDAGLEWDLPNTTAGWIVWLSMKIASAAFNLCIFHLLNKQGFINIQDNENYKRARELLLNSGKAKELDVALPRSERQYNKDVYGKKGVSMVITSLLGSISLSQAILQFDLKMFIVQLATLVFGLIMGCIQMKRTEEFYTIEWLDYAIMVTEKKEEEPKYDPPEQPAFINELMRYYNIQNAPTPQIIPTPQPTPTPIVNITPPPSMVEPPVVVEPTPEPKIPAIVSTIQPPIQTPIMPEQPAKKPIIFDTDEDLAIFIKQVLQK